MPPRIYLPGQWAQQQTIQLPEQASHYLSHVLRRKIQQQCVIFNGEDLEFLCDIVAINKKQVTIKVLEKKYLSKESSLQLHLAQGIAKGPKMDLIIQKAVELGVTSVIPVITEFTQFKLDAKRLVTKQEHWQSVAIAACAQCGRNTVPKVHPPQKLVQWLSNVTGTKLILSPQGSNHLKNLSPTNEATLLIGPEGGLSELEIQACRQHEFQSIQLGPRILRTETAGIVAVSLLQATFGDL